MGGGATEWCVCGGGGGGGGREERRGGPLYKIISVASALESCLPLLCLCDLWPQPFDYSRYTAPTLSATRDS